MDFYANIKSINKYLHMDRYVEYVYFVACNTYPLTLPV